ncbi:hypothetical protein G5B40_18115 [Pikeienuella piscinae]|uniref:Uncharacterized protein n=1 Tax=Pikeienuella piscinae TaxID=2748098 RepID=A0A7M3T5A4_9RHOB|nr:hypothetical protein [Pikeienuella piscinae]QIE57185.1 hypothetical protein G5B40_18115 [Pikeienuella piscinae]
MRHEVVSVAVLVSAFVLFLAHPSPETLLGERSDPQLVLLLLTLAIGFEGLFFFWKRRAR